MRVMSNSFDLEQVRRGMEEMYVRRLAFSLIPARQLTDAQGAVVEALSVEPKAHFARLSQMTGFSAEGCLRAHEGLMVLLSRLRAEDF